MIRHVIFESSTGDELGTIEFDPEEPDDAIIETLEKGGYLDPGFYRLDHDYFSPFDDDAYEFVVLDEAGDPVLTLEAEELDDDEEPDEYDDDESEAVLDEPGRTGGGLTCGTGF